VNAIVINRADISEVLLCQVAERFDVKKVSSPVLESVRFVEDLTAARPVSEDKKDDQTVEWNLEVVNAPEAWNLTQGEGVVVGVIDGGVRYTHEALVGGYRGNAGGVYNHDFNWHDPVYGEQRPTDTDGQQCLPVSHWISSHHISHILEPRNKEERQREREREPIHPSYEWCLQEDKNKDHTRQDETRSRHGKNMVKKDERKTRQDETKSMQARQNKIKQGTTNTKSRQIRHKTREGNKRSQSQP
jgi:hypothetical protein